MTMFTSINDRAIASAIRSAQLRVALAGPGFRAETASALIAAHQRLGGKAVTVVVDCDVECYRLGYADEDGRTDTLKRVRDAGCNVRHSAGLRIGTLVVDGRAWVFNPMALCVQPEVHSDETPNAVCIDGDAVEGLCRSLGVGRAVPADDPSDDAPSPEPAGGIEVGASPVTDEQIGAIESSLAEAPIVSFDIERQMRVFTPYIQYVEVKLHGAAIEKHKIEIPKPLLAIRADDDLKRRLHTTFDLIDKNSNVSSKGLQDQLKSIRDSFTQSLGQPLGRVMLRNKRELFDARIESFRKQLEEHRRALRNRLVIELAVSRSKIIEYYRPAIKANPPDPLLGQIQMSTPTSEEIVWWINALLDRAFPPVDTLLKGMRLEVVYRDVTHETLCGEGFDELLKEKFPHVPWDKPLAEFEAMLQRPGG